MISVPLWKPRGIQSLAFIVHHLCTLTSTDSPQVGHYQPPPISRYALTFSSIAMPEVEFETGLQSELLKVVESLMCIMCPNVWNTQSCQLQHAPKLTKKTVNKSWGVISIFENQLYILTIGKFGIIGQWDVLSFSPSQWASCISRLKFNVELIRVFPFLVLKLYAFI